MKAKKTSQGRARHFLAAAQKPNHETSGDWNNAGHFSSDFCRKKGHRVPGQQVPAEPERKNDEEQQHTCDPREFTRSAVRPEEVNTEQVDEQYGYKHICRPAVDRSDQPAETNFSHDELNALKCVFRAWTVIEQQENSCHNLHGKKKQRHPAEVIPDGVTMKRNLLFTGER